MNDYKPDIWRLQAQFDTKGLTRALQSDDAGIRKRAAAALRALDAKEAVPALRVAFMNEKDPDAKANIGSALEALADDPSNLPQEVAEAAAENADVYRLIDKLKSEDSDEIINAARELGALGDKLAVEPLVMIFNDSRVSIQVRLAVAEALLKLESAPVEVALLAALRHSDWKIRRNGAAILGQLKAAWAVEPLARAVRDPHPTVRRTAYAALKHIGTPEARRALGRSTTTDKEATKPKRPANMPSRPLPNKKKGTGSLLDRVSPPADEKAKDETGEQEKLQWPKSKEREEVEQRHIQPTKPLDPKTVELLEKRRKEQLAQKKREEEQAKNQKPQDSQDK